MNRTRILLTGGTGFLGKRLCAAFQREGHAVHLFKRGDAVHDTIKAGRYDVVIHCATCYGRDGECPATMRKTNVELPVAIFEEAVRSGVTAFINTDTALPSETNEYARTKKEFRAYMEAHSAKIKGINLELEQFFGAHDNEKKLSTFVIRQLLKGVDSLPLSPGQQKRHFLFVEDVISAYLCVLSNLESFQNGFVNFQVGTPEAITVEDFVRTVKRIVGNEKTILNFGAIPYRKNEFMNSIMDTSKMEQFGWSTKFTLEEGLRLTIEEERRV